MTGTLLGRKKRAGSGLVKQVVQADELMSKVEIADQLISLPYNPVRSTKKVLNRAGIGACGTSTGPRSPTRPWQPTHPRAPRGRGSFRQIASNRA